MLKRFFGLLVVLVAAGSVSAAEPERSVIQILTFSQQPVWDAPWRFESVRRSGGSGFVIKGNTINGGFRDCIGDGGETWGDGFRDTNRAADIFL